MRDRHQPLHPETRMALADLRRAGGKAILLLNRRGWSNFLSCRACGRVWLCPNCDVALVLHRHGQFIACHHCGHRERMPERCGACASVSVARHGAGTERIEHELREALGGRRTRSRSSGSTPTPPTLPAAGPHAPALPGRAAPACWSERRWWPRATTSPTSRWGSCSTPTRRCVSRTSAPRSGRSRSSPSSPGAPARGRAGGRVLVQTLAPDARSIRFAVRHDADGFIADELERRRALGYPPYASLIRVVCSRRGRGAGPRDGRPPSTASWPRSTRPCSARRRCFACAAARAASSSSRPPTRRRRSTPWDARWTASAPGAARRGAAVSVDVDPQ